ncbi:site-specific integrase [Terrabacter sp. MAHUQ-38]|uniref:tyrosine-type recombinase/integrase n=1 Tax=unclassified Terrabacter TaxID=2630222 RepID=UPI00165E3D76|nr:site-specific integrase [Terrabacter sp. MAHUQ-38]MBC9823914.1 site-specific integrase [Terrabacter sp. MAHUQ-38]
MVGRANRRGFGYLRKLPSKRWQASYVGPDLARYGAPSTFAAKVDAEAWLASERALISAGNWSPPALRRPVDADSVTFEVYARTWLRDRRLKPRTREGYEHLLQRFLLDDFGAVPLAKITPATVRAWWGQLNEATPTANARAYALLKAIMNTAVADEEIVANPCRIRSAASVPRAREVRPASVEELSVIVANLPENRRAIALLCSWCAMRIGEVLELRRKDVDLVRKVVRVQRSVAWVAGKPVVGSPKSAAGRRTVSIPPHVVPALKRHLDEFASRGQESLLFPAMDGTSHLQPTVFHDAFSKARAAAGRQDLRVHDLRHTGATLAAMAGATLAELQQRPGHSSVGAALRYQHAAAGRDTAIAEALSRMAEDSSKDE